ncbi:LysR family transcriptional regulator [Kaarinaea lacus]
MDINLIRTFLELNRTRHFGQAADNLCITQSAVSARIRLLEETVGAPLFTRQRNKIELTTAGAKFLTYADSMLNTWTRACQDVAINDPEQPLLSIGGTPSLWDIFLQDWLNGITEKIPNLSINAEVHHSETLYRRLLNRSLDVAIAFDTMQTTEIEVVSLRPVKFILVSTTPGLKPDEALNKDYIYVDWGTFFGMKHAQYFPDIKPAKIHVQLGRLALNYILEKGGSAYLAESMVRAELDERKLYSVEEAPVIERMTYAGFLTSVSNKDLVDQAIGLLMEY